MSLAIWLRRLGHGMRTSRSRTLPVAFVGTILVLLSAQPADGHVTSTTGYSTVRAEGHEIHYELSLDYQLLARAAGLGPAALDATGDSQRQSALDGSHPALWAYLEDRLHIFVDDVACEGQLASGNVENRDPEETAYARLLLTFDCPGSATGSYRIDYGVFAESDGVVDDHTNIVDYQLGGDRGREVLDSGHRSLVVGERTLLSSTMRFVGLGVEHILAGADHLLFVLALLLGATSVPSVAKVVSMFTLAHSVTLGLAVLNLVDVPAAIVEPLIALSIAYVAAENLFGGESRHRLAVVFGFGLLHGLGFASALRFTDEVSWGLVTSLVGFNLGIEVGQALAVLVAFPILVAARRFSWSVPVQIGATGAVAALGLFWFFQRVAFG